MYFLLKMVIFHGYVGLPECSFFVWGGLDDVDRWSLISGFKNGWNGWFIKENMYILIYSILCIYLYITVHVFTHSKWNLKEIL